MKCSHCGAALPDGASFCPHCEHPQIEKRNIRPPQMPSHSVIVLIIAALCAVLLAAILLTLLALLRRAPAPEAEPEQPPAAVQDEPQPEPEPPAQTQSAEQTSDGAVFDNGSAEILYTDADASYHVLLNFGDGLQYVREPFGLTEICAADGDRASLPSQLFVYRTDVSDDGETQREFMEKVASCDVQTVPDEGGIAMDVTTPRYNPATPMAARMSDVSYEAQYGSNDIIWTLRMTNGDVIRLRQRVELSTRPEVVYTPDDAPMDTTEALQALIDRIADEVDPETTVRLYLPPETFGEIYLRGHAFYLYGSTDERTGVRTTFTGTLHIPENDPESPWIQDISFIGDGSGTGVLANAGIGFINCTIRGWQTGVFAGDGTWPNLHDCSVVDNQIGLLIDSKWSSSAGGGMNDNLFQGNDIAVRIISLHGVIPLNFCRSRFAANGVDIDNPSERPIDISETVFD